jgi:hypothetical protein
MADSRLLVALCLSLLISSTAISLLTTTAAADFATGYMYTPIAGNFSGNQIPYEIDIMTMGNFREDNGVLISDTDRENRIYFISRWAHEGVYENTYKVFNPDDREYQIIIRKTNLYSDSIYARVTPYGVYVESGSLLGMYTPYSVFIPGTIPSQTEYDIGIILNERDSTITISVNGNDIGIAGNVPEDSILSWGNVKYAGISVVGKQFEIRQLSSTATSLDENSLNIGAFFNSLAGIMGWYTSSEIPLLDLFINIIIKIQQFGIVVVLITIIRGN